MSREADVYIIHRKKQAGPFSVAELRRQVASGNILRDTLVWYKGLGEWTPLKEAFNEEIEIEDTPRSRDGKTGLSLIRDDGLLTPPALPEGKWAGPGSKGGRLFIPDDQPEEKETLSTPQWEKREAEKLRHRREGSGGFLFRLVVAVFLGVIIWMLLK